jgi:hypothetical protein
LLTAVGAGGFQARIASSVLGWPVRGQFLPRTGRAN